MKLGVEIEQVGLADLQLRDEHAHLQAPIAHMHVADGLVADELEDAADGIADDGGAQMADMHRLGDVGSAVIQHHDLGLRLGRLAEARITGNPVHLPGAR